MRTTYPPDQLRKATSKTTRKLLDLDRWARHYLGSYFPDRASGFHRWLAAKLNTLPTQRGQRVNVLAPRGSAKSTWATFAFPLWAALHGLESYIILTSDTRDQAHKYLDSIRIELETNALLRKDYPELTGKAKVWREDRIRLANGVMIEALGTGTKLRGRKNRQHRPGLIICDDPQNTDHMQSALQRDRSWAWLLKDVCNAGSPTTNIVVLGTALHRECIVCKLQITPGWTSNVFKSIVSWPDRMDLWAEWEGILHQHTDEQREAKAELFYLRNKAEMDRGAEVLWPQREPLYKLMQLRASIGPPSFASEKQNDPINPDLCEWPDSYFNYPGFWFEEWPQSLEFRTLALDPSKGRDWKPGDYSAWVKMGRDKHGVMYVEADLRRRNVEDMLCAGVEMIKQFNPECVAIESNTFQELLLAPFNQICRREGVNPFVAPIENTMNKNVRIRRLGMYLSQRLFRFKTNSPGTQLLIQQARDFPLGDHDDGLDAAEMALRVLIDLHNEKRGKGKK